VSQTYDGAAEAAHPQFPAALSPWQLGRLRLRNRIFMSAHGTNYPRAGEPTQQYVDYMSERARGGVALVVTEGSHVHPTSGGPYMIHMWRPDIRPALQRLTDGVHADGGAIFSQLMHNGRQNEPVMLGRATVGPSPIRDPAHTCAPHALTRPEIAELVEAFAASAALAAASGFDGVEIHAGHGYLVEQFMSPFMNQRGDEYGGSHANRLRFARDVMRAVLDRVGEQVVVGARLTAFESVPGGIDRAEALDFVAELAAEGLHFVSVTAGQHASPLLVVPPAGVPTLPFLDDIRAVRKAVTCAVFASHRVRQVADVERVVSEGIADMVNMSRAHIADPALVNKAATGQAHLTRPCIGCVQGCRAQLVMNLPIGCLVNPRAGREGQPAPTPAAQPIRIAVIGGGIAGMQFASTAAERGHEVTLYERQPQLGGMFARSASLPEREEFAGFTDALTAELAHHGVDVRVAHEPARHELEGYDRVVVAVGATRAQADPADWPGSTIRTLGLDQALDADLPPASRVVIVDRGDHHNIAVLLARKFAAQEAASVDILDPTGAVARRLDAFNRWYLTRDFAAQRVRLASNVDDLRIEGSTVSFTHDGWPQTVGDVDVLVVIEPAIPRDVREWQDLGDVIKLGDCDAPGLAVEIVHQAYATALEI
jgi:2,4-dienoyl-CoA reductase-like NADH-dependent reductase (Old Yellow Enzyme family)